MTQGHIHQGRQPGSLRQVEECLRCQIQVKMYLKNTDEILCKEFPDYLLNRMNRPADNESNTD